MKIRLFQCNQFRENCYLVADDDGVAFIVDPGCTEAELETVEESIATENIRLKAILLTHAHFDHVYGVSALAAKYAVPVYMHPADRVVLEEANRLLVGRFFMPAPDTDFATTDIREGDELRIGSMVLTVIETPGHTPGGVCYLSGKGKVMFTGDTLFAGSIGRTDSPWGDYDKLIVGILEKLMTLDGDTDILPGHGPGSDIGYERTHNPFLQPFNEPEEEEFL